MADSNNKKAIKSGVWFTVSNFIVKGLGFITTPIFTRLLTKAEYGDFNNFTTWTSIILIITSLNLGASLIRARFDFEKDLDRYVFSMIALCELSTAAWYVIYNIFNGFFQQALSMDNIYIQCMFIYLFFYPVIDLFQNVERFKYQYKWTVASSMTIAVGSSLLSVLFVMTWSNKLLGRVTGYILPVAVLGIIIIIYYFIKARRISVAYWKYALPFTLPFIPHLLSMLLLGSMDRIMIKKLCGSEEVALYSLAYTVGTLISLLVTSLNNAYSPWLGEKLTQHEYKALKSFSIKYVGMFAFLDIGAVLITPELLLILGGRQYMEAVYVMPPVAAGALMQCIYCMYVNIEQFEKKTIGMAIASVIAAVINYILNAIFIPMFGYVAAAYTTFVGYFCLLLMHMYLVKRLGMAEVYQNKNIFLVGIFTSMIVFAMSFIMERTLIRYIVLAIYIVIFLVALHKYKDKIKALLKR